MPLYHKIKFQYMKVTLLLYTYHLSKLKMNKLTQIVNMLPVKAFVGSRQLPDEQVYRAYKIGYIPERIDHACKLEEAILQLLSKNGVPPEYYQVFFLHSAISLCRPPSIITCICLVYS